MNNVVYIIFPGDRKADIQDWYNVRKTKAALLSKGIQSNLICFSDYTIEEFRALQEPAGVIINHVITHTCSIKYASYLNVMYRWKSVFLNDLNSHDSVSNKIRMYHILSSNNIPIPKTIPINGYSILKREDADRIVNEFNGSVVVKPYRGFRGQYTFLCKTGQELIDNLNIIRSNKGFHYEKTTIKNSQAVIQEYVSDYNDVFVRVFATNKHMGGFFGLVSPFEHIKFNNFNNYKYKFRVPYKMELEISSMLRKALDVLNINVAGCDIFKDNNGYKIMDINAFGDFNAYDAICKVNFADKIVECFYNKLIAQGKA